MKALKYIGCGLCAAFLFWVLISWVDIVADNNNPTPQHSNQNFFVILFDETKG